MSAPERLFDYVLEYKPKQTQKQALIMHTVGPRFDELGRL